MAFRVAISGLKAASGELDVIGNNIANSNTTGFKKSRAEFVDVFAVSSVGGSGSTPGSGVRLSAIKQQFTQGNVSFTDSSLDMAINGGGFFILDDNGSQVYSRGGAFGVDRNGFLANGQGQNLIAFGADVNGNITGAAGAIQVNTANIAPQASSTMDIDINLDAAQIPPAVTTFNVSNPNSYNHSTSTTIFDSLGNSHLSSMYYVKTSSPVTATTVSPAAYTAAASNGTAALQNDSATSGVHTTSVATGGAAETYSITVDGTSAFSFTSTPNTAASSTASGAFTTATAAGGQAQTYSVTVDGTTAFSFTSAPNTAASTNAAGAWTDSVQGVGQTYSLTVDGISVYTGANTTVTAANVQGGVTAAAAALTAAGISVSGTVAGNDLAFTRADGTAFNAVVVNDTGSNGFAGGDFATGTNAASNAGTTAQSVTAAAIDTAVGTTNAATIAAAGLTVTGTAAAGTLAFQRADGTAFNVVVANGFTAPAGDANAAVGGFAGVDYATGTNAASNAGTSPQTVTAAVIDTGVATATAALNSAGITVSGTAAANNLVFSRADGTSFDVVVANGFTGTTGGFAGADFATGTNTANNGTPAVSVTDPAFTMSIDGTQFYTETAGVGGTVTAAELDSALTSFITGSGGAYTITSGSFAADNLVLSKTDGTDVAITIDNNFTATAGSFVGALTSTNGTPAVQTNTWEAHTYVDGTNVGGPDSISFSTAGALTVPAGGVINIASFVPVGGGAAMTLAQDYSASTQFGSAFSVNGLAQNGFTTGRLSGLDIDGDGIIFARFTNGQSAVQGQIALADFRNPQGLQPVSDTSWGETFASGAVTVGSPGTASLGLIQSGALEQSNVDLSEELVNMIIAQRSFQANAEVIQTSDTITQSIINLR